MTTLTIGQVAKQAHVSNDTIRLYERYGLIKEPPRAENGYRQYPPEAIEQLIFIKRTQNMGFTLKEIQELLSIHHTSKQSCSDVKLRAQKKLNKITEKMNELKKLQHILKNLVRDCEQHSPAELCPLFELLNKKRGK